MDESFNALFDTKETVSFVGRKTLLDEFYDWVKKAVIMKDSPIGWIHVHGIPGSGKTALLSNFEDVAKRERIRVIQVKQNFFPGTFRHYLRFIVDKIDQITPEWRSFIQRKRKLPLIDFSAIEFSAFENSTLSPEFKEETLKTIFSNFSDVNEKLRKNSLFVGIFIDDVDIAARRGALAEIQMLASFMSEMRKHTKQIFFVSSSNSMNNKLLNLKKFKSLNSVLGLELTSLVASEAELLLQRRKVTKKSLRQRLVEASSGIPFDLILRLELFNNSLQSSHITKNELTQLWGLKPHEEKLLVEISKHEKNYYQKDQLLEHMSQDDFEDLESVGFFVSDEGAVTITSHAVWNLVHTVFVPQDNRTELLIYINLLQEAIEKLALPQAEWIEKVQNGLKATDDSDMILNFTNRITEIVYLALQNRMIYLSVKLFDLIVAGLKQIQSYEKLGDLCEKFGDEFEKIGHKLYAANIYKQSGEMYALLDGLKKRQAKTSFREAGILYQNEAKKLDNATSHYVARSIFKKSIKAFVSADELDRAEKVRMTAMKKFTKHPQHRAFFETEVVIKRK